MESNLDEVSKDKAKILKMEEDVEVGFWLSFWWVNVKKFQPPNTCRPISVHFEETKVGFHGKDESGSRNFERDEEDEEKKNAETGEEEEEDDVKEAQY